MKVAFSHTILINKGHKKIGCLTGGIDKHISNQGILGFKKAMLESGLEIKDEWIFHGNFEFDSGISTAQIINEMSQKPLQFLFQRCYGNGSDK